MALTTAKALRQSLLATASASAECCSCCKLELGESSNLVELTTELSQWLSTKTTTSSTRRIRRLVVGSGDDDDHDLSEPDWTSHEAQHFMATLGRVVVETRVEELKVREVGITYGPDGPRFPVTLLSSLLSEASYLKRLQLSVRLFGTQEEFEQLAFCLRQQTSLKQVEWEEWTFRGNDEYGGMGGNVGDDRDVSFDFNSILRALDTLPELESLSIKAMTAGSRRANLGTLTEEALVNLVVPRLDKHNNNTSSLKQLQLVNFRLTDKAVLALGQAMKETASSTALQFLSLDLSQTGSMAVRQLFDSIFNNTNSSNSNNNNHTSGITEFQIWASTKADWAKDDCLMHLAHCLTGNTSCKSVAVLTHSRTLQEAVRNLTVVDDRVAASFVRMLETNCTLETLVLDDYGEEKEHHYHYHHHHHQEEDAYNSNNNNINTIGCNTISDDGDDNNGNNEEEEGHILYSSCSSCLSGIVNPLTSIMLFYLALNCSGRKQNLLQKYDTFSPREWTDALNMALMMSDEDIKLEIVYYLLRLNPAMMTNF